MRLKVWKPILGTQRHQRYGSFLRDLQLPKIVIEPGIMEESFHQARGVSYLLSQGERLLGPPERLVRIAQPSEGMGHMVQAVQSELVNVPSRTLTPVAVVESEALLGVLEGFDIFSSHVQGRPHDR